MVRVPKMNLSMQPRTDSVKRLIYNKKDAFQRLRLTWQEQ